MLCLFVINFLLDCVACYNASFLLASKHQRQSKSMRAWRAFSQCYGEKNVMRELGRYYGERKFE